MNFFSLICVKTFMKLHVNLAKQIDLAEYIALFLLLN